MTADGVIQVLKEDGPRTGAELLERTRMEPLPLWRLCRGRAEIHFQPIGRRFLRLDRAVEGYARLSPSIRREFLTYTVIGTNQQREAIATRCQALQAEAMRVSQHKREFMRF